jgi:tetratricopeptide (TPR) repeat protein
LGGVDRKRCDLASVARHLHLLADCVRHGGTAIAAACDFVAEWAEERGKLRTAVEFAQVASLVDPTRPMLAARAARILKERAEWDRAVNWYQHAIFIARSVGDWYAYADANCGLGGLHAERGRLPRARKFFKRALRAAMRHHEDEQIANAYHYLFTLEAVAGNWERAEAMAMQALARYPADSPRRPRLARDLAYRWILRGYFDRALRLAQAVLPHFNTPALRTLVWSDIARAAAGAGEDEAFESAWAQARVLLDDGVGEPYRITILLNLAHGAAFRGEGARARLPASEALELARSRGEPQSVLEAEALLDSIRTAFVVPPGSTAGHRDGGLIDTVLRLLAESRAVA